jgi:HlyD family secretion protein
VRLDQARSAGLTAGLPAQVVLHSNPGRAIAGKVARVKAVSDSVTEERVALVSFDHAPASLSVGEIAEVTLSLPSTENAVLLPIAAIKRMQSQTGVWVIDAGALRFVPVRIGQSTLDGQVQVLDGLKPGTTVVVHSEKDIGANSRIKVVDSLAGRQP